MDRHKNGSFPLIQCFSFPLLWLLPEVELSGSGLIPPPPAATQTDIQQATVFHIYCFLGRFDRNITRYFSLSVVTIYVLLFSCQVCPILFKKRLFLYLKLLNCFTPFLLLPLFTKSSLPCVLAKSRCFSTLLILCLLHYRNLTHAVVCIITAVPNSKALHQAVCLCLSQPATMSGVPHTIACQRNIFPSHNVRMTNKHDRCCYFCLCSCWCCRCYSYPCWVVDTTIIDKSEECVEQIPSLCEARHGLQHQEENKTERGRESDS